MMRRTELKRGTSQLSRKTPLRAGKALVVRKPMKTAHRPTGPDKLTVDAVYERAQHCCELCTLSVGPVRGVDHHVHHRRPRRSGGSSDPATNTPANLLLLCPACHETVESFRTASYEAGWLLRAGDDAAASAVLIWRGSRWTYLTDAGYADDPQVAA
jgi:5-methylcytosine-specific restriction enzyme A